MPYRCQYLLAAPALAPTKGSIKTYVGADIVLLMLHKVSILASLSHPYIIGFYGLTKSWQQVGDRVRVRIRVGKALARSMWERGRPYLCVCDSI